MGGRRGTISALWNTNTVANSNRDCYGHSYTYCYRYLDSYSHAYAQCHPYSKAYSDSQAQSDRKASPNTRASALNPDSQVIRLRRGYGGTNL